MALLLPAALQAKSWSDNRTLYNRWRGMSVEVLAETGKQYLLSNSPDTAMLLLNMAATAYNPEMTKAEKGACARAMNNAGYACSNIYHDYVQSYSFLLRAIQAAEAAGDLATQANAWLNIGNIYASYNDSRSALECYTKAFDAALSTGDTAKISLIYSNMASLAYSENESGKIRKQTEEFERLRLKGSDPMFSYSRLLGQALRADLDGDHTIAATLLEGASRCRVPERTRLAAALMSSIAVFRAGRPQEAADKAKYILPEIKSSGDADMLAITYSNLAEFYRKALMPDSADRYRLRSIELSDSIFNNRQYGMLKDMKFSDSMRRAGQEILVLNQEKRFQRIISIICGAFLLIVAALLIWLWRKHRRLQAVNDELYRKKQALINTPSKPAARVRESSSADTSLWERILKTLEGNEAIFEPDFTLDSLAGILGERPRTVSQTINDLSGAGFNALLADYRVREACRRLTAPDARKQTIEAIAQSVGFRSRSNFSAVFKKITGLSPGAYQKIHLRNVSKKERES